MGEPLEAFFNVARLPVSATVIDGYSGLKEEENLPEGQRLTLLYILRRSAAVLADSTGHAFSEALNFDQCRFTLMAGVDDAFDNKMYMTVGDVMRLQVKPRYVYSSLGYASPDGDDDDDCFAMGQLMRTSEETMSKGGKKLAVWHTPSSSSGGLEWVPLRLPFSVEGHFTTTAGGKDYLLSELANMASDKTSFVSYPLRIAVAGSSAKRQRTYTMKDVKEQQWLVASDGTRLIRIQRGLTVKLKALDMSTSDVSTLVQLLAERIDQDEIASVGPPPAASISAVLELDGAKPVLPPRSTPATFDDDKVYSYIEVGKPRTKAAAAVISSLAEEGKPPEYPERPQRRQTEGDIGRHLRKPRLASPGPSSQQDGQYVSLSRHAKDLPGSPVDRVFGRAKDGEQQRSPKVPARPSPKLPTRGVLPDQFQKSSDERPKSPARKGKPVVLVPERRQVKEDEPLARDQRRQSKNVDLESHCFQLGEKTVGPQDEEDNWPLPPPPPPADSKSFARLSTGSMADLLPPPPASKRLADLSTNAVADVLEENGLGCYRQAFLNECIDGELFAQLNADLLGRCLGVTNELHQKRILRIKKALLQ